MGMLNPWTSFVKSFILFATDEQGNFMGTWERNPFTQDSQDCPQSSESKYMIIPCGGVSKYEPHVQKHKFKILLTFFYCKENIIISVFPPGFKCYTICT